MSFEDTVTVETIEDFLKAIISPGAGKPAQARLWRGHGDESWRIDSTLFRRIKNDPDSTRFANVKSAMRRSEEQLVKRARHRGYDFIDGRQLNDFEVLARLRHHGAATSLLDVTKNPLVALWFACSEHPETDGAVFGFHTNYVGGREDDSSDFDYFKEQDGSERYDDVIVVEPPSVSPRVAAQSGVFLFSRLTDSELGSLVHDADKSTIRAIRIEAQSKAAMLKGLARHFAVSRISLFPDLEGFAGSHSATYRIYEYERW